MVNRWVGFSTDEISVNRIMLYIYRKLRRYWYVQQTSSDFSGLGKDASSTKSRENKHIILTFSRDSFSCLRSDKSSSKCSKRFSHLLRFCLSSFKSCFNLPVCSSFSTSSKIIQILKTFVSLQVEECHLRLSYCIP